MDLSIPIILILVAAGNGIFFAGFFEFVRQCVFPEPETQTQNQDERLEQDQADEEIEIESELKQLSRELKRM